MLNKCLFSLLILSFCSLAYAVNSPIGLWKTVDLQGNERSIIKFTEQKTGLAGRIIKLLPARANHTRCVACTGNLKNKPLVGLTIIWGLRKDDGKWINGKVLDVDSGKIYDCLITVSADNKTLNFTGYLGSPMLGATVHWRRQ